MRYIYLTIITLLLLGIYAPAQDKCDHSSTSRERFDRIRLLPPVTIRNFDLNNIEYTYEDKFGIGVGSLKADSTTVKPPNFHKEYRKKKYWLLYSTCDSHIYTIVEVLPEQIKDARNSP